MSITKQELAIAEAKWLAFWRQHPSFRCEANRKLMEQYLSENILSVASESGAEALEIAFLACQSRLAERCNEPEHVPQPLPRKRNHGEPRFNDPYWDKSRVREYLKEKQDISKPIPGSREEREAALTLPPEYTRKVLVNAPKEELDALKQKYSTQAIIDRLNGN